MWHRSVRGHGPSAAVGSICGIDPIVRTRRADEIVGCARRLLEEGAGDGLSMRRLANEMGIRAPSLYKHFPDKEAITRAVYIDYLIAQRNALAVALETDDGKHPIVRIVDAYREQAVENRALYLYLITLPYPRRDAEHVLRSLRRLWYRAVGDNDLAVAVYAFARGMAELEVRALYPLAIEPDGAYRRGIEALVAAAEEIAARAAESKGA